jgi:hypothetical protein
MIIHFVDIPYHKNYNESLFSSGLAMARADGLTTVPCYNYIMSFTD